jgi:hypothetical protein
MHAYPIHRDRARLRAGNANTCSSARRNSLAFAKRSSGRGESAFITTRSSNAGTPSARERTPMGSGADFIFISESWTGERATNGSRPVQSS